MARLTPGQEKKLYDKRRDLWAITRVLLHAPQYKAEVWNLLDPTDQDHLRQLTRDAKEHFKLLEDLKIE